MGYKRAIGVISNSQLHDEQALHAFEDVYRELLVGRTMVKDRLAEMYRLVILISIMRKRKIS